MFLDFYKLSEQPFGVTPNPRFIYPNRTHVEAFHSLVGGIESDLGFGVLIAQPGMGKTTLLFRVLEHFRNTAQTAFVFETQCDSTGLLRYLLREFEPDGSAEKDSVTLHERFHDFLVKTARTGRRVIVIIDEAQNLQPEVLESLRLLSNFETPRYKLLHLVLSGQPQLMERLAQEEMSQLRQRIPVVNWLRPLSADETAHYINHRLRVAGCGIPLFSDAALAVIASHSGGIPRLINRTCFDALSLGSVLRENRIDKDIVEYAIADPARAAALRPLSPSGSRGRTGTEERPDLVITRDTEQLNDDLEPQGAEMFNDPPAWTRFCERMSRLLGSNGSNRAGKTPVDRAVPPNDKDLPKVQI